MQPHTRALWYVEAVGWERSKHDGRHPQSAKCESLQRDLLAEFHVENLFGDDKFNNTLPLKLDSRVTAIIAPNGAGKTLCLRMIAGLFEKKWSVFIANAFSWVSYKFTDGTTVRIERTAAAHPTEQHPLTPSFCLTIKDRRGVQLAEWKPALGDPQRSVPVERYLPFLTRSGQNEWRHDQTGEIYDLQELLESFGDAFPEPLRSRAWNMPEVLTTITN